MDSPRRPQTTPPPKKPWNMIRVALMTIGKLVLSKTTKKPAALDQEALMLNGATTRTSHPRGGGGQLRRQNSFSCKSLDVDVRRSFISPKEYEFSFKDTPAHHHLFRLRRRPSSHDNYRRNRPPTVNHRRYRYEYNVPSTVKTVRKAFEMPNRHDAASLSPSPALPGFVKSPDVAPARQLRVTDSPFPVVVGSEEERVVVNREVEEFIVKFRRQLQRQNAVAESSPGTNYNYGKMDPTAPGFNIADSDHSQ